MIVITFTMRILSIEEIPSFFNPSFFRYIGLEAKNDGKRAAALVIIRVTVLTLICVTPQLLFSVYDKLNYTYQLNW